MVPNGWIQRHLMKVWSMERERMILLSPSDCKVPFSLFFVSNH